MAPAQGSSPGQQERTGGSSSSTSVGKAVPLAMQLEEQQQAMDNAAGVPLVADERHLLSHAKLVLHACAAACHRSSSRFAALLALPHQIWAAWRSRALLSA